MKADFLTREMNKGVLIWYEFVSDGKVLYIGNKEDAIVEMLLDKGCEVTSVIVDEVCQCVEKKRNYFDYVIAIGVIERLKDAGEFLKTVKTLICDEGTLLLGVNNRYALKNFCGDRDPYTGRNFDGIENYKRVSKIDRNTIKGMQLDRNTVEELLDKTGFCNRQFFSVLPNLEEAQLIYRQDYLPNEDLGTRFFPKYNYPEAIFLEEKDLYTGIIKNDMFHQMSSAYLYECSINDLSNVVHTTLSLDRGCENAMSTVIRDNKVVEKKYLYGGKADSFITLIDNGKELRDKGILIVESQIKDDTYIMPYIDDENAVIYFHKIFKKDSELFVKEVDRFVKLILSSSEHIEPSKEDMDRYKVTEDTATSTIWLKKGFLDMVPLNCFVINGEFVFIDQEFCQYNYPANAIITRAIDIIYNGSGELNILLPRDYFWEKYNLKTDIAVWRRLGREFTDELRNQSVLRVYNEKTGPNYPAIHSNRQRMNFSATDYQRLFVNIFDNLDRKKLVLFGSGNFTKKFLALYGKKYDVKLILDNSADKWGEKMDDIDIISPEKFSELDLAEYKVIICIKNYMAVLLQLQNMGVRDIGVYDPNMEYPSVSAADRVHISSVDNQSIDETGKKKYRTGYIAGVFDLFHIGHLNMFKRAKEQCEYLIVGVVTDEGVRRFKEKEPFIPFEERIEMVRSCRYVDEAVEIPVNFGGTRDAYRLYHFDVQFSGSDYIDNPNWLAEKEFLEKHGAEMVFFPYTEQTSSTKIKGLIEKKML